MVGASGTRPSVSTSLARGPLAGSGPARAAGRPAPWSAYSAANVSSVAWASVPAKPPSSTSSMRPERASFTSGPVPNVHAAWSRRKDGPFESRASQPPSGGRLRGRPPGRAPQRSWPAGPSRPGPGRAPRTASCASTGRSRLGKERAPSAVIACTSVGGRLTRVRPGWSSPAREGPSSVRDRGWPRRRDVRRGVRVADLVFALDNVARMRRKSRYPRDVAATRLRPGDLPGRRCTMTGHRGRCAPVPSRRPGASLGPT